MPDRRLIPEIHLCLPFNLCRCGQRATDRVWGPGVMPEKWKCGSKRRAKADNARKRALSGFEGRDQIGSSGVVLNSRHGPSEPSRQRREKAQWNVPTLL